MTRLKVFEFDGYCKDNKIDSFMFLSTEQSNDRFEMMSLELRQLSLLTVDSEGLIILRNNTSEIRLHDVKYININHVNPYFGIAFDVVCGEGADNIHRVVGKFNFEEEL